VTKRQREMNNERIKSNVKKERKKRESKERRRE
jgi:hypothetical protein